MMRIEVPPVKGWSRVVRNSGASWVGFAVEASTNAREWDIHVAPGARLWLFVDADASAEQIATVLYNVVPLGVDTIGDEAQVHHGVYHSITYRFSRLAGPATVETAAHCAD